MRQTKEEILKAVEGSPSASYKDLINEMFPDAGENPDARSATEYKPEQTWNYEIGTHLNLFNNRLRTDAALFLGWRRATSKSHALQEQAAWDAKR